MRDCRGRVFSPPGFVHQRTLRNSTGVFNGDYFGSFFEEEWDPFKEMGRIQKQINNLFQSSFGKGMVQGRISPFAKNSVFDPQIDIKESRNSYIITMDIPGMEKNNINIEVKNGVLIVSGERKSDIEEKQKDRFYRRERSFGYFSRSIPLPGDAKTDGIAADYKKGVLVIKIAKKEDKEKSSGTVKVNVN